MTSAGDTGASPRTSAASVIVPDGPSDERWRASNGCTIGRAAATDEANTPPSVVVAIVVIVGLRAGSDTQSRPDARGGAATVAVATGAAASDPVSVRLRNGQRTTTVPRLTLGQLRVDLADLVDDPRPSRVLEIEDRIERPVEVVGDVRDLFPETVGRVRQDPPGASPARSTVNSCPQAGQVTAASYGPPG